MVVKRCKICKKLLYAHNESGFCYFCITKLLRKQRSNKLKGGIKSNGKHNKR